MSRERDLADELAVQLRHGTDCGWIVAAAQASRYEVHDRTGKVRVLGIRIFPKPVDFDGRHCLRCNQCGKVVEVLNADVIAVTQLLESLLTYDKRLGVVTREDGRCVGSLRVALSG